MIARQPGGIGGFLDRFKAAGLAAEVASWIAGTDPVPLSGQEVEQTLGSDAISEIADKAGVSERFARTVLGYAIPKIISMLAQSGFLDVAIPTASSRVDEIPQPLGEMEDGGAVPWFRKLVVPGAAPRFGQLAVPGAALLIIILGVLGYFVSTGGAHHVATQSAPAPVIAKNAPVAVPSVPSVPARSGMANNAPIVIPPAPSVPARLALSNKNGLIVYSGTVEDDARRTAITDSLKTVFGANNISGELAVDKQAGPAGWTNDLKRALDNFKTPGSQALFDGNADSVGGTIPDADRDRIIGSLKSTLGPQFIFATIARTGATKTAIASPSPKSGSIPEQSTLNLPTIYFATNSAEVSSDSKAFLEQAAVLMKQLPAGTVVRISGFTDSTGNPTTNMKLSQRRANAVRQVLVDAGVNPAILSAKGYGIYHSTAGENETMEGRSSTMMQSRLREDRRVEFRIAHQ